MRFRVVAVRCGRINYDIFTLIIKVKQIVILNKIYTKTGDDGTTALGNGERIAKSSKECPHMGQWMN